MTARRIAAFDFDGTLTKRDTLFGFLVQACGRRKVARAIAAATPVVVNGRLRPQADGPHYRDSSKELLLARLFEGEDAERIAEEGRRYATTLPERLRPDCQAQVDWHRAQGHELVIVSASLLAYLEPFAADHGFDHVIAVGLEADADGKLTGRLTGPNVRGPEKAVRLRAWLDGRPADEVAALWAYGNSSGDHELLELNTHGGGWYGKPAKKPTHLRN
jgi:phosphatidylglycerophosphatase C